MKTKQTPPLNIDAYIATFPPQVQSILERICATIRKAAPEAKEKISYGMPSFHYKGALVYFGGFKQHIGFYPPFGDLQLKRETAKYAGEKGNLRFPLDKPIPYGLIGKIVKVRLTENLEKAAAKRRD